MISISETLLFSRDESGKPVLCENEMFLLLHMAKYISDTGVAFPGMNKLLSDVGWARQKFLKYIRRLEDRGFITVTERWKPDGGQTSNEYEFSIDGFYYTAQMKGRHLKDADLRRRTRKRKLSPSDENHTGGGYENQTGGGYENQTPYTGNKIYIQEEEEEEDKSSSNQQADCGNKETITEFDEVVQSTDSKAHRETISTPVHKHTREEEKSRPAKRNDPRAGSADQTPGSGCWQAEVILEDGDADLIALLEKSGIGKAGWKAVMRASPVYCSFPGRTEEDVFEDVVRKASQIGVGRRRKISALLNDAAKQLEQDVDLRFSALMTDEQRNSEEFANLWEEYLNTRSDMRIATYRAHAKTLLESLDQVSLSQQLSLLQKATTGGWRTIDPYKFVKPNQITKRYERRNDNKVDKRPSW